MEVISQDPERVKIFDDRVVKVSSENEIENLKFAKKFCETLEPIVIEGKAFSFYVPKIIEVNDTNFVMERCFGENLEIMLRTKKSYNSGTKYVNAIFLHFIKNNFLWKDFAPRNILVDVKKRIISIFDFERGFENQTDNLVSYFVNNVYEEYSAFILSNDRAISVDEAFKIEDDQILEIEKIKSRRFRMLLGRTGFKNTCKLSDQVNVVKMIIKAEEPYIKNGKIIFPLVDLEDYLFENGYDAYCDLICEVNDGKQKNL